MNFVLLKQSNLLWAVFDADEKKILVESQTFEDITSYILDQQREEIKQRLTDYVPTMSWEMAQFQAKRLKCCDCTSVLDSYNAKWPLEKQRCSLCLAKY